MGGVTSHRGRRYLIVSLHDQSWGRTSLGLSIASGLRDAGAKVSFVLHETNASMLEGKDYESWLIGNTLGPLVVVALQQAVAELQPDALVLCDYFGTCNLLHRLGIEDLEFLFDRPVISLDLWDSACTGFEIDRASCARSPLCLIASKKCQHDFMERTRRITPVPIAHLKGVTPRVRLLPQVHRKVAPLERRQENAIVLTTTANWQHDHILDESSRRIAEAVPELLARHLAALGSRVLWFHVGPKPFYLNGQLKDRYHWLGQVSPRALDELFSICDLVISVNASATTTLRAILESKPVVLAQNSYTIGEREGAAEAGLHASEALRCWIEQTRPIRSFRLWPLGYHDFLTPLVKGNPYFDAVTPAEILCEDAFIETCDRLLFDPSTRAASAAAQRAYLEELVAVPGPADAVDALL